MKNNFKVDDVIFNFFKQICDEKDDKKCVDLGNSWITAMETNLVNMENNLNSDDKTKYNEDIKKNIALAMVSLESSDIGTILEVEMPFKKNKATIVEKPFYDPKKEIASS